MSSPTLDPAATGVGLWLRKVLKPGHVVMDVGANVGHYTTLAAKLVGPSGHVYAFEPAPSNVAKLHEQLGAVSHVSIIAAAVNNRSGDVPFFLDLLNNTQHSLVKRNVGRLADTITVPQVTLDQYLDEIARLDTIRISAQGAELDVLRGAHELLERFRPRIVFTLWPYGLESFNASSSQLFSELSAMDYVVHRLSAKGGLKDESYIQTFLNTAERWSAINAAAIPKEKLKSKKL